MVFLLQRLDSWARRLVPAGLSIVCVLVSAIPVPIPGYGAVAPMLALASVFFWAIHHPALLPPVVIFAIGLFQDIVTGGLMGAHAVVLLLVYGAMLHQRVFFRNKSFLVVWWGFAMVVVGAAILAWALASAFSGRLLPADAVLVQGLLTVALYPLLTWVFHGVHRLLPRET